jgi:hypothetical protein
VTIPSEDSPLFNCERETLFLCARGSESVGGRRQRWQYLESATFVTGETLHVDGGAHAGHS